MQAAASTRKLPYLSWTVTWRAGLIRYVAHDGSAYRWASFEYPRRSGVEAAIGGRTVKQGLQHAVCNTVIRPHIAGFR